MTLAVKVALNPSTTNQIVRTESICMNLLFTNQQNFRPVQTKSFCRQQIRCDLKIEICFQKG